MHFLFHYPNRRGIGFYGCSASPAFGELRESLSVWKCMFWNGLVASEWIRKREFPSRERERGGGGDARREPMQNKTVRPADPNGKEAIYVGWRIKAAHLFSISRNNP